MQRSCVGCCRNRLEYGAALLHRSPSRTDMGRRTLGGELSGKGSGLLVTLGLGSFRTDKLRLGGLGSGEGSREAWIFDR